MRARNLSFAVLALSALLPYAHGASYPVTGSGGGIAGSGTFYTTANGDGSQTVINVTGTGVTGLLGVNGFNNNDNLLFPSATPVLDSQGVSFTDTMGDTNFDVNLFSNSQGAYFAKFLDSDGVAGQVAVNLQLVPVALPKMDLAGKLGTGPVLEERFAFEAVQDEPAAVTPEPSSIALLGTGLMGIAGVVRRRLRA